MSDMVRSAEGKPNRILISEIGSLSFNSDLLSNSNELLGKTGIDKSHYPTREPESVHIWQDLKKP